MEETRKLRAASRVKLCYHERKLKELQTHLERGTHPKRVRLRPYPKMKTPQGQALIHEACDEVQKIMLIQMVEEEQQALAQAQNDYKNLQEKKPRKKEDIIKSLQKELKSMRARLSKLQKEATPPTVNQSTQTSEAVEGGPENSAT